MTAHSLGQNPHVKRINFLSNSRVMAFVFMNLILMFFFLGDSLMSYISPIFFDEHLHSSAVVGLVIGSSSIVGLLADAVVTRFYSWRNYRFFVVAAALCGVMFPGAFLLFPHELPNFLFGMAIWGVYYELIYFAKFKYIKAAIPSASYPLAWGVITSTEAIAISAAPILAGTVLASITKTNIAFAFAAFAISFALFQVHSLVWRIKPGVKPVEVKKHHHQELHRKALPMGAYLALIKRVWPLLLCIFGLNVIDAAFWTIGPLFSLSFFNHSPLSGFFLSLYVAPSFLVGLLAQPLAKPFGKKRMAFITLILGGLSLAAFALVQSQVAILGLVAAVSIFCGIAYPELLATFEDYVCRLGDYGGHMIALQRSSVNVAYVLSPIFAGLLASVIGFELAFSVAGVILVAAGITALLVVPRKILMPHHELFANHQ